MSKVEEIKEQIRNLSREELAELRDWFWELASLLPLDAAESPAELDSTLDTDEAPENPGRLVQDVIAKIRKNV
jgi:hypothetical protein